MTHAQPLPQTSEPGLQSPGNFDTPRKPKVKSISLIGSQFSLAIAKGVTFRSFA